MAPYYGGYDPSAQLPLLAQSLAKAQMQNRRPLEMRPSIPYDPQVAGGYSGQIEGHSGPAQFASLLGNLAKSIGPQILAGREAKRKQDAATQWGNIVNQSKRVMGPYAPQVGEQTITRPRTQLGGERGEPIVTETIPGQRTGPEPYRLRTPTERLDNVISTGLQSEYPEVREASSELAVQQLLQKPDALTASKTYYPPSNIEAEPRDVRTGTDTETRLINEGWVSTKPDRGDAPSEVTFYDNTEPGRNPVSMLTDDPLYKTLLQDREWHTEKPSNDSNDIEVFWHRTTLMPVDVMKSDTENIKKYVNDPDYTTGKPPDAPDKKQVMLEKREKILAELPPRPPLRAEETQDGSVRAVSIQMMLEQDLDHYETQRAAEAAGKTLDDDRKEHYRDKIRQTIDALEAELAPDEDFSGTGLAVSMQQNLQKYAKKLRDGEVLTQDEAAIYDRARMYEAAPKTIVGEGGEITVFIPDLSESLFPILADDNVEGFSRGSTVEERVEGEVTALSTEELQLETVRAETTERAVKELEASGYTLRTVLEGDDLTAPLKSYILEAADIMEGASREGEDIYSYTGAVKRWLGGMVRPVTGSDWGLRATALDKVLTEIQLALAPEKIQESRFSDNERKMLKRIVGELHWAKDGKELQQSLIRLADFLESAEARQEKRSTLKVKP